MKAVYTYLPQDRLRALAQGKTLPDRTQGAALFADISGFTPLTEVLRESLGPRRGAEELTRHLDAVYTALINQVEGCGGSVIGFAGDAIMCWFDDGQAAAAPRAAACAFAMQSAMHAFDLISLPNGSDTSLSLKVAIASGPARRLVVGDPEVQYLDALAGATVVRTSTAEHLANGGDILVDESTVQILGETLTINEWRSDADSGERFALVNGLKRQIEPILRSDPFIEPDVAVCQNWMPRVVYDREQFGQSSFLTEFRPCTVLFVRFLGIDYDAETAQAQLDTFIRQLQSITSRHNEALLQLTIGDKGSYVYVNFGAFSAHEDDARRALKAALELKKVSSLQLQMGITQGVTRVGAYGGQTRRTYGALGDEVNLAARLMQTASTGEILLSGAVQKAAADHFNFEPRPPLPMKGKAEPLPVFAVTGERHQRAIRLQEPTYALPMVGRKQELEMINEKLQTVLSGKSQIIGIVAEAGMGKSRLTAEVIRSARKKGFVGYGGACQSDAIHTPYQAWKSVWQAFFDVDPSAPLRKQIRLLEGEIEDRVPERVESLPLLGILLNLDLPENDFTKNLEPKYRQSALQVLLEDCLKVAAQDEPMLIVLEDLHWIDVPSLSLLDELARALADHAVCFVVAYRPPQLERLQTPRFESLPNFTRIELSELDHVEAEQAIRAKLAQLYPARGGAIPSELVEKLMARAQGNPFYLEELLNYLRDRGLDPLAPDDLKKIELPDSLHALILSRIDQLSEREKNTLRVASIVGRLFRADWLTGYYPSLGALPQVKAVLEVLNTLDITPLDAPEPELAYLFKHIVTHEVTYESLPFATRAQLHEQLARYLEATYPNDLPIDVLAFHYSRSDNLTKKREYLRRSGEAAQAAYSNTTALEYYEQALACLPDEDESITLHINSGSIYQLIGQRDEAYAHYQQALQIATASQLVYRVIECETRLGNAWIWFSDYSQALEWLEKAREHASQVDDVTGIADVLCEIGIIHSRLANYDLAAQYLQQSIDLFRQMDDKRKEAYALSVFGMVKAQVGNFAESHTIFEAALALSRELNDKRRIAGTLNNFSTTYYYEGNYGMAQKLMGESLEVVREIGDKRGIALALNNLGNMFYMKNDFSTAQKYYEESLKLGGESDDKYTRSIALSSLGITVFRQGHLEQAETYYQESLVLNQEMGDKVGLSLLHCYFGLLALAQGQPGAARRSFTEGLTIAHQSEIKLYIIYNLIGMACVFLAEGILAEAVSLLAATSTLAESTGLKIEPELQVPYDQAVMEAREKLSGVDFQSAWAAGQGIMMEDAVSLAIKE